MHETAIITSAQDIKKQKKKSVAFAVNKLVGCAHAT